MEEESHSDDAEGNHFPEELRKAAEIGQSLLLAKMELSAKLDDMAKDKRNLEFLLGDWNSFAQKLGASTAGNLPASVVEECSI